MMTRFIERTQSFVTLERLYMTLYAWQSGKALDGGSGTPRQLDSDAMSSSSFGSTKVRLY